MRDREQIEESSMLSEKPQEQLVLMLEVLLDIRELLLKEQNGQTRNNTN